MENTQADKLIVTERTIGNSITVMSLIGRFDAYAIDETEMQMNRRVEQEGSKFILDMKDVNFLGSSGIRILISISQKVREKNGKFAIINMPESGFKIIKCMEITHLFNIINGEEAAIDFVNKE